MFKCQQCGKPRKDRFKRIIMSMEMCKDCFHDFLTGRRGRILAERLG